MNSVERVQAALRRQQPDRVPAAEFYIDDKVVANIGFPCTDMFDCMDKLGLDVVGAGVEFDVVRCDPDGSFVDEWGVTYRKGAEFLPHPILGPVRTLADAQAYTPPDPNAPGRLGQFPEAVARYKGRRAVCFHHRAAFMWSAYVMGLDHLLASFLLQPDVASLVMDKVLECNMGIVRNAIRAGADVIVLGDDYAHNFAPMMSPETFREFILPRLRRMIDMIHEEGALCIKHTDGNIYSILDMIVEAGPDGLNPLEPAAGMELKRVKELVGDRICLVGNIDCGSLLAHGTADDVQDAVRQAIADAAAGGGYIVTSSNSIHSSCRPDNVVAMIRACHELGQYA